MDFVVLAVVDLLGEVIDLGEEQVVDETVLDLDYFVDPFADLGRGEGGAFEDVTQVGYEHLDVLGDGNPLLGLELVEQLFLE